MEDFEVRANEWDELVKVGGMVTLHTEVSSSALHFRQCSASARYIFK